VPGTAAPIVLNFMDVVGSIAGSMLPTGNVRDLIDGIEVTCIDVAMPMILLRAKDLGLTGYEGRSETTPTRRCSPASSRSDWRRGGGWVSATAATRSSPRSACWSPSREGGTIASRYLTPHALHAAHAVTGAVCVSTACAHRRHHRA
jgi:2-methylaconitate cis-trans-isomerase PrpF